MKIDFFETEHGMDIRAAQGGVYQVELVRGSKSICLYIGESVWIASRCGKHLFSVLEEPEYFGLTKEDIDNDDLTLKFTVITRIEGKKSELGRGSYKEMELLEIKKNNPLTQLQTSDRQIKNTQDKVKLVQNKMKELKMKSE